MALYRDNTSFSQYNTTQVS